MSGRFENQTIASKLGECKLGFNDDNRLEFNITTPIIQIDGKDVYISSSYKLDPIKAEPILDDISVYKKGELQVFHRPIIQQAVELTLPIARDVCKKYGGDLAFEFVEGEVYSYYSSKRTIEQNTPELIEQKQAEIDEYIREFEGCDPSLIGIMPLWFKFECKHGKFKLSVNTYTDFDVTVSNISPQLIGGIKHDFRGTFTKDSSWNLVDFELRYYKKVSKYTSELYITTDPILNAEFKQKCLEGILELEAEYPDLYLLLRCSYLKERIRRLEADQSFRVRSVKSYAEKLPEVEAQIEFGRKLAEHFGGVDKFDALVLDVADYYKNKCGAYD